MVAAGHGSLPQKRLRVMTTTWCLRRLSASMPEVSHAKLCSIASKSSFSRSPAIFSPRRTAEPFSQQPPSPLTDSSSFYRFPPSVRLFIFSTKDRPRKAVDCKYQKGVSIRLAVNCILFVFPITSLCWFEPGRELFFPALWSNMLFEQIHHQTRLSIETPIV